MNSPDRPGFIPPHGHYRELLSYQKAEVIYDLTFNKEGGLRERMSRSAAT